MHDVAIRRASVREIVALRHAELRPGRPLEAAVFDGDHETATWHFGGFRRDEVVGCASFYPRPRDGAAAWQLRGMAVRGDLRGRGIGAALLGTALGTLARDQDTARFWCNARVAAVGFYTRFGWQVVSDVFEIPDVGPHRIMEYRPPG